jgi:hypothetical protein
MAGHIPTFSATKEGLLIRPEKDLDFVTPAEAGVQLIKLDSGFRRNDDPMYFRAGSIGE